MAEHEIVFARFPATIEEFVALRDEHATSPQGGAALLGLALAVYGTDVALGLQCLTVAFDPSLLADSPTGYKNKTPNRPTTDHLRQQLGRSPYIGWSYVWGTSPQTGYAIPPGQVVIKVRHQDRDPIGEDSAKMFVHSTGADTPRPVHLAKNNRGLWKAKNWTSLSVGVRAPVVVQDDDI